MFDALNKMNQNKGHSVYSDTCLGQQYATLSNACEEPLLAFAEYPACHGYLMSLFLFCYFAKITFGALINDAHSST